jgi:hypothetical protein
MKWFFLLSLIIFMESCTVTPFGVEGDIVYRAPTLGFYYEQNHYPHPYSYRGSIIYDYPIYPYGARYMHHRHNYRNHKR